MLVLARCTWSIEKMLPNNLCWEPLGTWNKRIHIKKKNLEKKSTLKIYIHTSGYSKAQKTYLAAKKHIIYIYYGAKMNVTKWHHCKLNHYVKPRELWGIYHITEEQFIVYKQILTLTGSLECLPPHCWRCEITQPSELSVRGTFFEIVSTSELFCTSAQLLYKKKKKCFGIVEGRGRGDDQTRLTFYRNPDSLIDESQLGTQMTIFARKEIMSIKCNVFFLMYISPWGTFD